MTEDAIGRMRIAMLSAQASPLSESAGQAAHVAELCAGLSASMHDVVVYTRREDAASRETVSSPEGYQVVHVPVGPERVLGDDELAAHLGDFAEFVAGRWRRRPPDVVHAHHWTSGLVSVVGAHRLRIPVVHSYHGLGGAEAGLRTTAEGLIARRAARIVATSSAEAVELWQSGVRRAHVSVVPSGVDPGFFTPEGPVEFHDGRMRVLLTGELDHGSAAAIGAVLSTVDNVELVDTSAVRRGDRPAVLRSADVAVCAPLAEGYGMAALEAMACGVPVVATAVGALSDVVLPGVTGVLVGPRDVLRLARSVKALLSDETRREQFGTAARDRVLGRYSRRRLAGEAIAVYERATCAATGGEAARWTAGNAARPR
ncbi:glycosyltransferase [Lentzea jiangxiensis]|uniref:Glycosyltransferase involved in cell wall bisynthesis n=1 Tax=Lentzea jiangxiensis TaxID=641025 RepID=A0A1H0X584_9PSEU|nr:glycosyltransferase [Lentzea jiangxiensis]SDP97989.1 Glycosyltransferase involved in cell wall bisynthesis [Lentzea jiangxiensis]